ncbi:MAG TPA: hypothetical protein VL286_06890 [Rhizomicrobium sp.]|jgi:hypothetical protein|nr:hypothetical protein [Rhizomicrobium sp.]
MLQNLKFLLAAIVAVGLTSCSTSRLERCPPASVLVDTGTMAVFRSGSTPDPANVLYTVQIAGAQQDCELPKFGSRVVTASVDIDFRARRSSGSEAVSHVIPYFVAITSEGKILAKREFTVQFTFDAGQQVATFSDSVNSLAVSLGRDKKPTDYGILVGFQLTKAQLDYNRRAGRYAQ